MRNPQEGQDEDRSEDVISIGEGGNRGWIRWVAVLGALVVGLGIYQLTSDPDPAPAAQPASFQAQVDRVPAHDGRMGRGNDDASVYSAGTLLHLGSRDVKMHGAGVSPWGRSTAFVLGRLHNHWMVRLRTTSCESDKITVTYGAVRASGRFTLWKSGSSMTSGGFPWVSPDGSKALMPRGRHLQVRQAGTNKVLAVLTGARSGAH